MHRVPCAHRTPVTPRMSRPRHTAAGVTPPQPAATSLWITSNDQSSLWLLTGPCVLCAL
jgi:hypothetical protein